MTMTSFLQRMLWRDGDNHCHTVTDADSQTLGDQENAKEVHRPVVNWLKNRSELASNIPEVGGVSCRPTTLRLFGTSKKLLSDGGSCQMQSVPLQGAKTPTTLMVENAVKEFEDNYKSPTKATSKKSKNFVKKLVAALEWKNRVNEADDLYAMRYSTGPIYAYDQSDVAQKSEVKHENLEQNLTDDFNGDVTNVIENATVEPEKSKTAPRIIGAFLKKPIEVDNTSIYWIPITGKKLPRKKSFKKLLAKLTGKSSGNKKKQVVFASQEKLIEEIHDSGYEERSTSSRTSSLTSFNETLMYHDNDYVDKAYKDCDFSTFITSSPMKKFDVSCPKFVNSSKDLSKMFARKEISRKIEDIREDSGYISNQSILEESMPMKNLVATRVQQISCQLAKLPKHPFVRSEPRLYNQKDIDDCPLRGEIVTIRRCKNEPIYDVPRARPQSSNFEESLSMRRKNVPIQTVSSFGHTGYPVFSNCEYEEQPHYATIKPRNTRTHVSYENLKPNLFEEQETFGQNTTFISKKNLHSSFADLTANQSFVITMYV